MLRKVVSIVLVFVFLLLPGISIAASTPTKTKVQIASGTDLKKRMKRLPGEGTMYDPDTGVYFNPFNGRIENFKRDYQRLPGENLYYKKNQNLKYFTVSIYTQFTPKLDNVSINKTVKWKNGKGFTVYAGGKLSGGLLASGSGSYSLALSYDYNTKKWYLGEMATVGAGTVIGEKLDARFIIGVSNGNQTTLDGAQVGVTGSTPILDCTVSNSTEGNTQTVEIAFGGGTSFGVSDDYSYTKSITTKIR